MGKRPPFDVLLFDLGGVLIDFAGFEELGRLLPATETPAAVRRRWIGSKPVELFERGDITPQEFAARLIAEWRLDISEHNFLRDFVMWARGPYPGALRLIRGLREFYAVAFLSNSNELHTPIHRAVLGELAEECYFSNELGLLKPQPEIFEHVLRDLAVPAARIAFFDDTAVNVDAADRIGMSAHRVDGFAELRRRLEKLGVLNAVTRTGRGRAP